MPNFTENQLKQLRIMTKLQVIKIFKTLRKDLNSSMCCDLFVDCLNGICNLTEPQNDSDNSDSDNSDSDEEDRRRKKNKNQTIEEFMEALNLDELSYEELKKFFNVIKGF